MLLHTVLGGNLGKAHCGVITAKSENTRLGVTQKDASSYSFRGKFWESNDSFWLVQLFSASAGLMLTVKMMVPMNLELLQLLLMGWCWWWLRWLCRSNSILQLQVVGCGVSIRKEASSGGEAEGQEGRGEAVCGGMPSVTHFTSRMCSWLAENRIQPSLTQWLTCWDVYLLWRKMRCQIVTGDLNNRY